MPPLFPDLKHDQPGCGLMEVPRQTFHLASLYFPGRLATEIRDLAALHLPTLP